MNGKTQRWSFGIALVLLMLFTLFPFYWAIVASLTSEAELFRAPSLWPGHLIFDHIGRGARQRSVNDDLHIADIRQRVQRNPP